MTTPSLSRRYPWARFEPPDKLMVAMSRDLKGASEDERRRLVDESLDRDWRDVTSDELLDAWRAVVCFRCECNLNLRMLSCRQDALVTPPVTRARFMQPKCIKIFSFYSLSTAVPEAMDWDDPRVAFLASELDHRAHGLFDDSQVCTSLTDM